MIRHSVYQFTLSVAVKCIFKDIEYTLFCKFMMVRMYFERGNCVFITIICLLSVHYEATRLIAFCLLLFEIYGFDFIFLQFI